VTYTEGLICVLFTAVFHWHSSKNFSLVIT